MAFTKQILLLIFIYAQIIFTTCRNGHVVPSLESAIGQTQLKDEISGPKGKHSDPSNLPFPGMAPESPDEKKRDSKKKDDSKKEGDSTNKKKGNSKKKDDSSDEKEGDSKKKGDSMDEKKGDSKKKGDSTDEKKGDSKKKGDSTDEKEGDSKKKDDSKDEKEGDSKKKDDSKKKGDSTNEKKGDSKKKGDSTNEKEGDSKNKGDSKKKSDSMDEKKGDSKKKDDSTDENEEDSKKKDDSTDEKDGDGANDVASQMHNIEKKINEFNASLKNPVDNPESSPGSHECVLECDEVLAAAIDDIRKALDSLATQNLVKAKFDVSAVSTNVDTCNDCFDEMVGGDPKAKKLSDWVQKTTADVLEALQKADS